MCKLCKERGKTWKDSNTHCAFKNGKFDTSNWNCLTMNTLRDLVGDWDMKGVGEYICNDNQKCGICIIPDTGEFLVLSWYKRRGRTEGAWIISEDKMRVLTLEDAERILKEVNHYEI